MAYSFHNQNMGTISNVLVIHTALDNGETASTTAFTIPSEVMARVMKTGYGKFVVTNSIPVCVQFLQMALFLVLKLLPLAL